MKWLALLLLVGCATQPDYCIWVPQPEYRILPPEIEPRIILPTDAEMKHLFDNAKEKLEDK